MYRGFLTHVNRKTGEVVGAPIEDVEFTLPEIGKTFPFIIYETEEGVRAPKEAFCGKKVESIIESEGRAGRRLFVVTEGQEFIIRNVYET